MSDPTTHQHPDEEEVINSDVFHSLSDLSVPPSKSIDKELMPVADEPQFIYDQPHGFSDPPSIYSDKELMPVPDEPQLFYDQLQEFSDPPSKYPDEELHGSSDPPSMRSDKELFPVVSDQLQGFSVPPSLHPDEELMLVDDQCQIVSDQQLQGFSYPLDTPSKPLDGELMLVDPVVEVGSQVKKEEVKQNITSDSSVGAVLQDVEYGELECFVEYEEMPALIYDVNNKDGMSDQCAPLSKDLDVKSKTVSDQLHVFSGPSESSKLTVDKMVSDKVHFSDPSESSLIPVEEFASLDGEVKNLEAKDFHPGVEEVSQVKGVLDVDVEPSTTLEPKEVELAPGSVDGATKADNIDYYTFSLTNYCFSIIISKSHIKHKYYVNILPKTAQVLPQVKVPLVFNSYGTIWHGIYNGHCKVKSFEISGWRKFAVDNKLKIGDACFFEVLKNSPEKIVLKVIIVRTDPSPSCVEEVGTCSDQPIYLE